MTPHGITIANALLDCAGHWQVMAVSTTSDADALPIYQAFCAGTGNVECEFDTPA